MMKKITVFLLGMVMAFTLAGCGADKNTASEEPAQDTNQVEEKVDETAQEIKDFFEKYVNTSSRPVAVMIDNDNNDSRPQAGLEDAYLMYEMAVEGGATRFMALFRNADTAKIGPVRSSRHYFLDYAKENDAIYTHYGWSPRAIQDISNLGVNNINGINGVDANVFWRERKYAGDWHSAYTSIEKITSQASAKSYRLETDTKNSVAYSTEYISLSAENTATEIKLPYSGMYSTGYKYNTETGLYEKLINNAPHKMQSGNVLAFKNVIVIFIADRSLGDGSARREIITTGSGKGYYFTNGTYEEISWSKASRTGASQYKKADGSELLVNPGSTVINIINPACGITIQ